MGQGFRGAIGVPHGDLSGPEVSEGAVWALQWMCQWGTPALPSSSPKLEGTGGVLGCSSPGYVGWPRLPCSTPGLAFVSRWVVDVHSVGQGWVWMSLQETQILPPVRRAHGPALSTAFKSPLGFARSSQQHSYQIMPLDWSCRLGCRTLAGEAIDSTQTAWQDREEVWSVLLCSFLTRTRYDHHDTGIQQLHDIKCFIIAGCVIQLPAWGGTHRGELWMRRIRSVNAREAESCLWKHLGTEECTSLLFFLALCSSARRWISLAKMLTLKRSLPLFID